MRCEELREELVDFADGELPPLREAMIAAHVAKCPVCRRRVEELQRSLAVAQAVWSANERLGQAEARVVSRRSKLRRRLPRMAAGLAVAAGVLMALTVWRLP